VEEGKEEKGRKENKLNKTKCHLRQMDQAQAHHPITRSNSCCQKQNTDQQL